MSFRIEDKYLINQIDYIKVKKLLQKNNFKETYEKRLITSLYFDNKFLSMFHDSEEGLFQEKKYGLDIITMTNQKFFLNSKLIVLKGSLKDQKKFL